jgi:hypothetical protein
MSRQDLRLLSGFCVLSCAAIFASAQVQVFTDEGAYLAAINARGFVAVSEGFEGSAWDGVRTTASGSHAALSVVSQGLTWTGRTGISTSLFSGRSGWGAFDSSNGDPDILTVRPATPLFGIGGWYVTNAPPTHIGLFLDGASVESASLALDTQYRFVGVLVPAGFSRVELRDTETGPGEPRNWFADDFTFAAGSALPRVSGVVPGVANSVGLQGSDWHTNLYLHNASTKAIGATLFFSPKSGTVDPAKGHQYTVGAGQTLTLADVVSTVFGVTGSGAIFWQVPVEDEGRLLVSANTFNRVDAVKRLGQQVPGQLWTAASGSGTSLYAPALANRYRTNLGFSTDSTCTRVVVRAYDRLGIARAERTVDIPVLSWFQFDDLFGKVFVELLPAPGTVPLAESVYRFEVVGQNGKIVAYTSIVDNASNDASFFLAQSSSAVGPEVWLLSAAYQPGANGSQWRSDLLLMSLSNAGFSSQLAFAGGGDNSAAPAWHAVPLGAQESQLREKVLSETLSLSPPVAGSLRLQTPAGSAALAFMRTYSEEQDPVKGAITLGQAVVPLKKEDAVGGANEGRIYGFSDDAGQRSNLLLQNIRTDVTGRLIPSSALVEVFGSDGAPLASHTYALAAGEYLQINKFMGTYGLASVASASLRLTLVDDAVRIYAGGFLAMVAEVNGNTLPGTNDSRLLRAEVVRKPGL